MNAFVLHNLPTNRLKVVSFETSQPKQGWDEIEAVVEGAMSESALRALYRPGLKYNKGLGFYLDDPRTEPAGAGFSRAMLRLRGLFQRKVWGLPSVALATRNVENLQTKIGGRNVTIAKAAAMDATPVFRAHVYDAVPPPYSSVGKTATTPPAGLVFPALASTPWTFWGAYTPTVNVPSGWVMTDVQSDVIEASGSVLGSNALHGKELTYTWFWQQVP